jgi:hypothetical protein
MAQQLGVLAKDSLGNCWIKIIHALPRYEGGVTVINRYMMACAAASL